MASTRTRGRAGVFFSGFFTGILFTALAGLAAFFYVLDNPPAAALKVGKAGMSRVVKRVSRTIPKDYMQLHQDEITDVLSRFVRAYAAGLITPEDMDTLTQKGFEFSADQTISESEIDQMLQLIRTYADRT
ncbi:hypothetical protein JXO52_13360 [bacterium]|nr:hypothetical protein [bacterium]